MNFAKTSPSIIKKPRVAISSCLMGHQVRYNGKDKLATQEIPKDLFAKIEWISLCPEIYMGLSVPRPPMNLYLENEILRLKTVDSQKDLTSKAIDFFDQLSKENSQIAHWVLKSKSPSCGYYTTPHYSYENNYKLGHGLFVERLLLYNPKVKIYDERIFKDFNSFTQFYESLMNS